MNDHSFKLMEKYIPATYVQQAQDARRTRANLVNQLLEKVHQLKLTTSHSPYILIFNFPYHRGSGPKKDGKKKL
jgi:hypothetical protein